MHTIVESKLYFSSFTTKESNVCTIPSIEKKIIEDSGRAKILLFGGTQLNIENAQYSQDLIEIY
jgi:hypothetical protein